MSTKEEKAPEDKVLRGVLSSIVKGYSLVESKGEKAYIKHFNNNDQGELEESYKNAFDKAKKNGLPTEPEAFEMLHDQGIWTKEDESDFQSNKSYISTLKETKKNLIIPSQIEKISEDILGVQKKIDKQEKERSSLLCETCESYARNKSNDYSIYLSLYEDKNLKTKLLSKGRFEEMSKQDLSDWFLVYLDATKDLDLRHIKYLAISNIFSMYYNILGKDQLFKFFNKPVYTLTFYQLNLLNYAKILNSIIENIDKIPESVKENPDQLLDYAESKSKNKDVVEKSQDKQGFSVVGATSKDMGELGVSDSLSVSPFDLAKKKGSLTIEDFQNFS